MLVFAGWLTGPPSPPPDDDDDTVGRSWNEMKDGSNGEEEKQKQQKIV